MINNISDVIYLLKPLMVYVANVNIYFMLQMSKYMSCWIWHHVDNLTSYYALKISSTFNIWHKPI